VLKRKRPLAVRNTLENRLWARLKLIDGIRWRRRVTFKTFLLDFVAHDARLVIELLDGEPGRTKTGQVVRDRLLNEYGYTILRLWRDEAQADLAGAVARIKTVLSDLSAHDS
jgi:crossover junction endodeoxyribonuclease RuvC